MYCIGNNHYNYSQLYSSMFILQNSFDFPPNNRRNLANGMVSNYAKMHDRQLTSILFDYSARMKEQTEALTSYEHAFKEIFLSLIPHSAS